MPLYMDLHKASDYAVKPTVEEIKRNHIADLAVQHKYGVKFIQYWINEDAGLVFCLMEAPGKESCIAVHREAHGDMPCNVIELQGGDYMAFMGDKIKANQHDIVEKVSGVLDSGYRVILIADIISFAGSTALDLTTQELAYNTGGRFVRRQQNRSIFAFNESEVAIKSALEIIKAADNKSNEIRIGISAGEPVTQKDELFGDSIMLANRLCDIAQSGQIIIAPLVVELTSMSALENFKHLQPIKIIDRQEEDFIELLITHITPILSEPDLSIDSLCRKFGISRSQLYRKITSLTGSSAQLLIKELRLLKALRLIQSKYGNITQVAMESGFSNPSYFAKNFQERFGISPLKLSKMN